MKEPTKKRIMIVGGVAVAAVGLVTYLIIDSSDGGFSPTASAPADSAATAQEAERPQSGFVENMEFVNGDTMKFTYTGWLENGLPTGTGTGVYANGTYEGNYIGTIRDGEAVFVTSDSTNTFKGKFKGDYYYEGKLYVEDSTYFEGKFANGEPWQGTWHHKDGNYFTGTFRNGQPWDGVWYYDDGEPFAQILDGKETPQ